MLIKKYKSYIYFFLFLIFFPFLIKHLNYYGKNRFLNNLYFNLPIYFSNKKICRNYDLLTNKYLDKTISFSLIDNKGNIISEYNSEISLDDYRTKLKRAAEKCKILRMARCGEAFSLSAKR